MTSLAALATRNFTTVLALILMACAGLGVAADARLALCLHETADAGNYEDAVLLGFLDGGFRQQVKEGRGLLVGQFELLGQLPREGGLGQSSCHCIVLLLGALWAAGCCLGFRRSRIFRVRRSPDGTAWRECDQRQRLARNPCIHAGSSRTLSLVTMRLRAGQSQWEKADFHNFLGVFGICLFLPSICPIFSCFRATPERDFCPENRGKTRWLNAGRKAPSSSAPERPRWACSSASTTGAASLKWRMTTAANVWLESGRWRAASRSAPIGGTGSGRAPDARREIPSAGG